MKITGHPALLWLPPVNHPFVSFAESTDNFVSSKSALPFALKLVYSEPVGNYASKESSAPGPPAPQPPAAQHGGVNE